LADYLHVDTILYCLIIIVGVPLLSIQITKLAFDMKEIDAIVKSNRKFLEQHIHKRNMFIMLHRLGMRPYE
jgi:hypothetical protein